MVWSFVKIKKGFTLIEISMVLAIIGILATGSLFGLNLLQQSKSDSLVKQYQEIKNAMGIFITVNGAIPGDINDSIAENAYSGGDITLQASGNGDNKIAWGCSDSVTCSGMEAYNFFPHLYLARLIDQQVVDEYFVTNELSDSDCSSENMLKQFLKVFVINDVYWIPTYLVERNVLYLSHITGISSSTFAGDSSYGTENGISCDTSFFSGASGLISQGIISGIDVKIDGARGNGGLFYSDSDNLGEGVYFLL